MLVDFCPYCAVKYLNGFVFVIFGIGYAGQLSRSAYVDACVCVSLCVCMYMYILLLKSKEEKQIHLLIRWIGTESTMIIKKGTHYFGIL